MRKNYSSGCYLPTQNSNEVQWLFQGVAAQLLFRKFISRYTVSSATGFQIHIVCIIIRSFWFCFLVTRGCVSDIIRNAHNWSIGIRYAVTTDIMSKFSWKSITQSYIQPSNLLRFQNRYRCELLWRCQKFRWTPCHKSNSRFPLHHAFCYIWRYHYVIK